MVQRSFRRLSVSILSIVLGTLMLVSTSATASAARHPYTTASSATYVALGDSFASGDGNLAGGWLDQNGTKTNKSQANDKCDRSKLSYPSILSRWLPSQKNNLGLPSMSFHFLACSGDTTSDVTGNPVNPKLGLRGATGGNGEGVQLKDTTDLTRARIVTVQVGGDNLGFGDIFSYCIEHSNCNKKSKDQFVANLGTHISELTSVLTTTYHQIMTAAPNARLFVVGYPDIFTTKHTTGCQGLSGVEVSYLVQYQDPLNQVIKNAIDQANSQTKPRFKAIYVDPNTGPYSFVGHDVCNDNRWFNELNDHATGSGASFHPNQQGQGALAQDVEAAITANDTSTTTTTTTTTAPPNFTPGARFDDDCVIDWPTAPTYTSNSIEMTMGCVHVPEGKYLFTQVVYNNPNFQVNADSGTMHVVGRVIDVARSDLGFSELEVQASQITILGNSS